MTLLNSDEAVEYEMILNNVADIIQCFINQKPKFWKRFFAEDEARVLIKYMVCMHRFVEI